MKSPKSCSPTLDIKASVAKYEELMPSLLSAHALTGCDTVAAYYGIGKLTMLKSLNSMSINVLGKYAIG